MPILLSKLIPFRDYFYAAVAVAAVIFYNVHVHELEVGYAKQRVAAVEAADKAATDRTLRAAKDAIDAKEKQYTLQLSQVEDTYETQLKSADDQHNADLARVRQLTAASNRGAGSVLSGSGSSGAEAACGALCAAALGAGAELAAALRQDDAALTACYDERDKVTGK